MGSIIYIIGLVLAILAVIDICKKPISLVGKVICCVVVLATDCWSIISMPRTTLRSGLNRAGG